MDYKLAAKIVIVVATAVYEITKEIKK